MVARCINNRVKNPSYTVGKTYKITDIGIGSNFWEDPKIDQWNGQFSTDLKPEFNEGTKFKRKGCMFIIEKEGSHNG